LSQDTLDTLAIKVLKKSINIYYRYHGNKTNPELIFLVYVHKSSILKPVGTGEAELSEARSPFCHHSPTKNVKTLTGNKISTDINYFTKPRRCHHSYLI